MTHHTGMIHTTTASCHQLNASATRARQRPASQLVGAISTTQGDRLRRTANLPLHLLTAANGDSGSTADLSVRGEYDFNQYHRKKTHFSFASKAADQQTAQTTGTKSRCFLDTHGRLWIMPIQNAYIINHHANDDRANNTWLGTDYFSPMSFAATHGPGNALITGHATDSRVTLRHGTQNAHVPLHIHDRTYWLGSYTTECLQWYRPPPDADMTQRWIIGDPDYIHRLLKYQHQRTLHRPRLHALQANIAHHTTDPKTAPTAPQQRATHSHPTPAMAAIRGMTYTTTDDADATQYHARDYHAYQRSAALRHQDPAPTKCPKCRQRTMKTLTNEETMPLTCDRCTGTIDPDDTMLSCPPCDYDTHADSNRCSAHRHKTSTSDTSNRTLNRSRKNRHPEPLPKSTSPAPANTATTTTDAPIPPDQPHGPPTLQQYQDAAAALYKTVSHQYQNHHKRLLDQHTQDMQTHKDAMMAEYHQRMARWTNHGADHQTPPTWDTDPITRPAGLTSKARQRRHRTLTETQLHNLLGHQAHKTCRHTTLQWITHAPRDHGGGGDREPRAHPCTTCIASKITRAPQNRLPSGNGAQRPGERVSFDVCGPFPTGSRGEKYVVLAVDQFSGYAHAIPTRTKGAAATTQALTAVTRYYTDRGHPVEIVRSDNGPEFRAAFTRFCSNAGLTQERTANYSPAQNGSAERGFGRILTVLRSLMAHSGMSDIPLLWPDAVKHATLLVNITPNKSGTVNKFISPWRAIHPDTRVQPQGDTLHVWGSEWRVTEIPKQFKQRWKGGAKGLTAFYMGQSDIAPVPRFYMPELQCYVEGRHVACVESLLDGPRTSPPSMLKDFTMTDTTLWNQILADQSFFVDTAPRQAQDSDSDADTAPDNTTDSSESDEATIPTRGAVDAPPGAQTITVTPHDAETQHRPPPTPPAPPHDQPDDLLGRRVLQQPADGPRRKGKVVDYQLDQTDGNILYHVQFIDGDHEELYIDELRQQLQSIKRAPNWAPNRPRRHRPRRRRSRPVHPPARPTSPYEQATPQRIRTVNYSINQLLSNETAHKSPLGETMSLDPSTFDHLAENPTTHSERINATFTRPHTTQERTQTATTRHPARALTTTAPDGAREDIHATSFRDDQGRSRGPIPPNACRRTQCHQLYYPGHIISATDNTISNVQQVLNKDSDVYDSAVAHAYNNPMEPTIKEAMRGPEKDDWHAANVKELATQQEFNTHTVVPRSEAITAKKKILRTGWRLTRKTIRGKLLKLKSRFFAKGFLQPEADQGDTASPCPRAATIRMLIAQAAEYGWLLRGGDITCAFLTALLPEPIYLEQPEFYAADGTTARSHVLKCTRAIYGLKSSSRLFYLKVKTILTTLGFTMSTSDVCLFQRITDHTGKHRSDVDIATARKRGYKVITLTTYVDDIAASCSSQAVWDHFVNEMQTTRSLQFNNGNPCFRDEGPLTDILGLEIDQPGPHEIRVHHTSKIRGICQTLGLDPDDPRTPQAPTPCRAHTTLPSVDRPQTAEEQERIAAFGYREVVGALLHVMVWTMPCLGFVMGQLCRHVNDPRDEHIDAVRRVGHYLIKCIRDKIALTYVRGTARELTGYVDSDYAECTETRKSVSGWVFFMNGAAISWGSKKQSIVALSTTEAELCASRDICCELLVLRRDLRMIDPDLTGPARIFEDNASCIAIVTGAGIAPSSRTKHIAVRYFFARSLVQSGVMLMLKVPSTDNISDTLTKSLCRDAFSQHRNSLYNHDYAMAPPRSISLDATHSAPA